MSFKEQLRELGESINYMPTEVSTMSGLVKFDTFLEAKKEFPTLDPFVNGKDFTWATRGGTVTSASMRFDSWEMERLLSM